MHIAARLVFLAAVFGSLLLAVACAQEEFSPAAVREAIVRLGAEDFATRQAATDFLWKAGPAAESELRTALKSSDPEVKNRAASLLDKLRYGLRPDTPPDVLALIDQFRFGERAQKQRALAELRTKGHWSTVFVLLQSESDPLQRQALAQALAPEAGKFVRPLVERGQLDDAQAVLELVADREPGRSQLAAFLILTGRIDDRAAGLKQKPGETQPGNEECERLAMLQRARGDLTTAIAAAEQSTDKYLLVNLLSEARDWMRVAPIVAGLQQENAAQPDHAAFAATFHRLAGNEAGYQEMVNVLRIAAQRAGSPAGGDPIKPEARRGVRDPFGPAIVAADTTRWVLVETLLINEQIEEAIKLLKENWPQHAMVVLRRTHRVGDALELAKIVSDKPLDQEWLGSLPAPAADDQERERIRREIAGQSAQLLHELGRREQLDQVLAALRAERAPASDSSRRKTALAKLLWQLGRYDEAIDAALQADRQVTMQSILAELLRPQLTLALFWHDWRQKKDPLKDARRSLADAIWMASPSPPAGRLPADWRQQIEEAAADARRLEAPRKAASLAVLGEIALVRGDRKLAAELFAESAELNPQFAIRAGDLAAGDKNWQSAEEWFRKAADVADAQPLAVYLQGHALAQLGRSDEGQQRMQRAGLLALTPQANWTLATALQQRGLTDDAVAKFQLVRRTGPLDSSLVVNSAQQIGNLTSRQDPLRAADSWEQLLLHVLNESSNFQEPEAYLRLPHVIHKARAKGLLAQGKHAEASAELAACERIMPADVRLAEELIPLLDKAGRKEDADKLFDAAHAIHKKICDEFPSSSMYLNNTAWICARARRRLGEALPLATRATELSPEVSAYWDTLAEVHFQRDDRPAAVSAAIKARDLSPANPFYQGRLKHFETSPPGTDASEQAASQP
jgi:tetratricopeptide (TPR) repeat protein